MIVVYQQILARLDASDCEYSTEHHEPPLISTDAS